MRASSAPAVVFFYERPRCLKPVQHTQPARVRWELLEVSRGARPDASMAAGAAPRLAAAFMTLRTAARERIGGARNLGAHLDKLERLHAPLQCCGVEAR